MVDRSMNDDPLSSRESNTLSQNSESSAEARVHETSESENPLCEPNVPPSSSSRLVVDRQHHVEDSIAEARANHISEASLAYGGGGTDKIVKARTVPGKHSASHSEPKQAADTGDAESNLKRSLTEKTHVNGDEKSTHFLSPRTTEWTGAVSPPNLVPITAEPGGVQGSGRSKLVRLCYPSAHGPVGWIPQDGGHVVTAAASPLPVARPIQYFPPHSLPRTDPGRLGYHPMSIAHGALPSRVYPFSGQHAPHPAAFHGPPGVTQGAQGPDYSVFRLPGYSQALLSPLVPPAVNTARAPDGGGRFKFFHPGENHPHLPHAQHYHNHHHHQLHHLQPSQLEGMPATNIHERTLGNTPPRGTSGGTSVPDMPPQSSHGHVYAAPPRASSREGHIAAPAPSVENVGAQSCAFLAPGGETSSSSADAAVDNVANAVTGDTTVSIIDGDAKGGEAVSSGGMECEERERQNSVYNDIGLVVARTKALEMLLKDLFGASGNGLNDLLSSLKEDSRIDRRTQQKIRSVAAMRNKLVHSVDANKLSVSNTFGDTARRAFKKIVDDLETTLQEAANKEREEPFEQGTRPTDAYMLRNHPAFRGIVGADDGEYDEAAAMEEAAAAQRAVVIKDKARFPHNLTTTSGAQMTRALSCDHAPDVADSREFPGITFSVAGRQRRSSKAGEAVMDSEERGGSADGATGSDGVAVGVGSGARGGSGGWDGQGKIEETKVVSGRGGYRKLGQGDKGHVATTHTMSGVYRKWDLKPRNPMPSPAWNTGPKDTVLVDASRVVPGAGADVGGSTGKVAFSARGLDFNKKASRSRFQDLMIRARSEGSNSRDALSGALRNDWEEVSNTRRKRGQKEDNRPPFYVKSLAAPFWLVPGVRFGGSNCRGWFPTRQDWYARGMPQCVYVPLEPSTEDRIEAMRYGHGLSIGLTLEEDEERLMRIAIRESGAASKRAYEKKYGTQAEQEARREAQESLEREEREQLEKGIKASLQEALGPMEEDDRDVIATIEASKLETSRDEDDDPETLRAIAESRRQHETRQEMLQLQLSYELDTPSPHDEGILTPNAEASVQEQLFNRTTEQVSFLLPDSSTSIFSVGGNPSPPRRDTPVFPPEAEAASGVPLIGTDPKHSKPVWPSVEDLEGSDPGQEMEVSVATTRGSAGGTQSTRYPLSDGVIGVSWPGDAHTCIRPDEQLLQTLQFRQSLRVPSTEDPGGMLSSTESVRFTDGLHRNAAVSDRQPAVPQQPPPLLQSTSSGPQLAEWASPAQVLGVRELPDGDGITAAEDTCDGEGGGATGSIVEYREVHEVLEAPKGSSVVGLSGTVAAEERELEAALEASRQAEAMREQEERDAKAAIDMALELSVKEATAPPGAHALEPYVNGHDPPPVYAQPAYPEKTVPSADLTPFRKEGDDGIGSSAHGETLAMASAHPGEDPSMQDSVRAMPTLAVTLQEVVPGETEPAVGHSDGANTVLHPNPTIRSPGTNQGEMEEEDKAARDLRIAIEKENEFYASSAGGAGKGNGESLSMDPDVSDDKAEGGEDELVSMLKDSRLDVEQYTSPRVLEEEDVIARVLETSRREKQEEIEVEHRDLEKALLASLRT